MVSVMQTFFNISRKFMRSYYLLNTPTRLFLNFTNRSTFNLFQAHVTHFFNAFKYIGVFATVRIRAVRFRTFDLSVFLSFGLKKESYRI